LIPPNRLLNGIERYRCHQPDPNERFFPRRKSIEGLGRISDMSIFAYVVLWVSVRHLSEASLHLSGLPKLWTLLDRRIESEVMSNTSISNRWLYKLLSNFSVLIASPVQCRAGGKTSRAVNLALRSYGGTPHRKNNGRCSSHEQLFVGHRCRSVQNKGMLSLSPLDEHFVL
jgi:hypothetical protein